LPIQTTKISIIFQRALVHFEKGSATHDRDGFRERGALGHLSFWGPTQVWPIWPFLWKAWNYVPLMCSAPSKIYLLLCWLSSTIAL